jgi:hypothetical protein
MGRLFPDGVIRLYERASVVLCPSDAPGPEKAFAWLEWPDGVGLEIGPVWKTDPDEGAERVGDVKDTLHDPTYGAAIERDTQSLVSAVDFALPDWRARKVVRPLGTPPPPVPLPDHGFPTLAQAGDLADEVLAELGLDLS